MSGENECFGANKNDFAKGILERGYFPENLPPVFRVKNFHDAAFASLISGEYVSAKPTEPVRFSASKRGGARRQFEMPNPSFMVDCAIFFNQRRSEIFEHYETSNDSMSVPKFHEAGRSARIASFSDFHRVRRQRLATCRFVVRTDISRYYHSIYTHSIPWALHGKPQAKKDRKTESGVIFGNRLDYICRQAKDGQTIGIPVGPDFSRYISEIIGKAIDAKFRKSFGDQCVYVRHVDDIFIGADDHDEATRLLTGIQDAVQSYELDLNDRKTSIVATNLDLEDFWTVQIRREIVGFSQENPATKGSMAAHDFVYFLDEVIRIANTQNDDGVIKYALRRMDEYKLWSSYWSLVEPFLIRVIMNFPHCLDYVARIAAWRQRTAGVNKNLWGTVVNKVLRRQSHFGNDSEVCWALWLAKEISSPIEQEVFETIILKCGAIAATVALDLHSSVSHAFAFPKSLLLDRLGDQPMLGPDWLLSYEADRLFGYKLKSKNLNGLAFANDLYTADTEFYDVDAVPQVFEDTDDPKEVDSALDDVDAYYDDDFVDVSWAGLEEPSDGADDF